MSSTHMNDSFRSRLYQLMKQTISVKPAEDLVRKAYLPAAPLVRKIVEKKYPPKDMKICAKYGCAKIDDYIKLLLTSGGVVMFLFDKGTGPLAVIHTYSGIIYTADEATTDAVATWNQEFGKAKSETQKLHDDYGALIQNAKTLEEIEQIWPGASVIRPYTKSQALARLSDDVVARIKADVQAREDATTKIEKGE